MGIPGQRRGGVHRSFGIRYCHLYELLGHAGQRVPYAYPETSYAGRDWQPGGMDPDGPADYAEPHDVADGHPLGVGTPCGTAGQMVPD